MEEKACSFLLFSVIPRSVGSCSADTEEDMDEDKEGAEKDVGGADDDDEGGAVGIVD
jgi:hypothetical protein